MVKSYQGGNYKKCRTATTKHPFVSWKWKNVFVHTFTQSRASAKG